jgi:hypothetical protein
VKVFRSKKAVAVLVAGAIALGGAGAALAYFTSSGNGTGSGTVGAAGSWTVGSTTATATGYATGLQPGVAASDETVTVNITNAGTGQQELNSFTISVANGDGSPWSSGTTNFPSEVACTSAEFTLGGQAAAGSYTVSGLADDLAPGATYTTTVNLHMLDNSYAQDNCQSATVPLYIAAS